MEHPLFFPLIPGFNPGNVNNNASAKAKKTSMHTARNDSVTATAAWSFGAGKRSEYAPLQRGDIRLLSLSQDQKDLITFNISAFPHDQCPPYAALSYSGAAGEDDPKGDVTIFLNGCRARIRRNLFEFLQEAWGVAAESSPNGGSRGSKMASLSSLIGGAQRQQNSSSSPLLLASTNLEYLWIDALCINQEDVAERSSQVARVRDIYERSSRIIVWLGPGDETSDLAFEAIEDISEIASDIPKDAWGPLHAQEISDEGIFALRGLKKRRYWSRAWTLSEITMPRDGNTQTSVWCGDRKLDWEMMRQANAFMQATITDANMPLLLQAVNISAGIISSLTTARDIGRGKESLTLLSLLEILRENYFVRDPRDKVYAALAMAHDRSLVKEMPLDYTLSTEAVYQQAAIHILEKEANLNLLAYCSPGRNVETPSWIPDWTQTSLTTNLSACRQVYDATAKRTPKFQIMRETGSLIVEGLIVDTVTEVSVVRELHDDESRQLAYTRDPDVAEYWADFLFPSADEDVYVNGDTVSNAANWTLSSGVFFDHQQRGYQGPSWELPFLEYLKTGDVPIQTFTNDFFVNTLTTNRRLFWTKGGYLGLANPYCEPGDCVCIVFGCNNPLVLRRAGNVWEVIGEAYVHGIMNGEAVTGDKPVESFELC